MHLPVPKDLKLTAKQERFSREILIDGNGTRAAIAAGHSKKTAASIASENLRKPNVLKFIELLKEDQRRKSDLDASMIITELRELAFWNIQDFIESDNSISALSDLSRRKTKSIIGIKIKETFIGEIKEVTTELKLADKKGALVDLGRHLGIFEKDNAQKSAPVVNMTDDQFEKLLNTAREAKAHTGK